MVIPLPAQRPVHLIELLDVFLVSTYHSQLHAEVASDVKLFLPLLCVLHKGPERRWIHKPHERAEYRPSAALHDLMWVLSSGWHTAVALARRRAGCGHASPQVKPGTPH